MENISINFLVHELKKTFPDGSPISRISLRKSFLEWRLGRRSLVFSLLPRSAPFFLSESKAPGEPISTSDINVLRKYLDNGRLTIVEKPVDERIIRFTVEKTAIWGERVAIQFIVNAGRVPTSWTITDAEDRILWSRNEPAAIAGTRYLPPEDDRIPLEQLHGDAIRQADNPKALYGAYRGLGPAMARELMAADDPSERLSVLLAAEPGPAYAYPKEDYPVVMTSLGQPLQQFDSLSAAIEARLIQSQAVALFEQRRARLLKRTERELARKQGLLTKLEAEQEACREADRMIRDAELLSAGFTQLKRGMREVTLADLTTGEPVTIQLDPNRSPHEIVTKLYRKAARWKRKAPRVAERIRVTRCELGALADEQYALSAATSMEDLPDVRPEKAKGKDKKTGELSGILRINFRDGFFA